MPPTSRVPPCYGSGRVIAERPRAAARLILHRSPPIRDDPRREATRSVKGDDIESTGHCRLIANQGGLVSGIETGQVVCANGTKLELSCATRGHVPVNERRERRKTRRAAPAVQGAGAPIRLVGS
jgi:hypothetical protein